MKFTILIISYLQPNQYYKNSKNLTDSEKEISNFQKYKNQ